MPQITKIAEILYYPLQMDGKVVWCEGLKSETSSKNAYS